MQKKKWNKIIRKINYFSNRNVKPYGPELSEYGILEQLCDL